MNLENIDLTRGPEIPNLIYNKDGVSWVDIKNLKPNPINKFLYENDTPDSTKVKELAVSMREEMDNGNPPNTDAIGIYPDGLISKGHTRFTAGGMIGATRLKAEYVNDPYPNKDDLYRTIKDMRKTNIYREHAFSVKLNVVDREEYAYEKTYGGPMPHKDRIKLYKSMSIAVKNVKRGREIKELRPDLLKAIDSNSTSIENAWNVATGNDIKVVGKKKGGVDLFKIFTPEMKTAIVSKSVTYLKQLRALTIPTKDGEISPVEDDLGWEPSRFTGVVSDTFMTSMGVVFYDEGYDVTTANGHVNDPDVYLVSMDERMEVKVNEYKGDGAKTTWKGGKGIRAGEYLLVSHNHDFTRIFIMFATLNEEDWSKKGNVGTELKLSTWWKNHKDIGDFEFWKGEIYSNGDTAKMHLDDVDVSGSLRKE